MGSDPGFIFYPGDYLRDTQCLSERSQVAYDRIMCEHMRNICISHEQHEFFTKRLTADEKKELAMVLQKIDGGYCIPWVVDSITKRREYSESRRKNRKGKKKNSIENSNNISKSYDSHMENEIEIEIEKKNKKESADFSDYELWTESIIQKNDQFFETMLMNARLPPNVPVDALCRAYLALLAQYPNKRPPDQHRFRIALLNHISENAKNGQKFGNKTTPEKRVITLKDLEP